MQIIRDLLITSVFSIYGQLTRETVWVKFLLSLFFHMLPPHFYSSLSTSELKLNYLSLILFLNLLNIYSLIFLTYT